MSYSAHDHIQHFLSTVVDYEHFEIAVPLARVVRGYRENDPDKWFVIAHAMMLRKYFSGNHDEPLAGDNLALHRVIRSLRQSVVDPDTSAAEWDRMEANVKRLESNTRYEVNGMEVPEMKLMENELYSRFLHGDSGRWGNRSKSTHSADHAMWSATISRHDRVLKAAQLIRTYVEDDLLKLDQN